MIIHGPPSHIAAIPPAAVAVVGVHVEIAVAALAAAILAITQANVFPSDLADLEMDPIGALPAAVVVKADNKGVNGQIGKSEIPHLAVDGDPLGVAHTGWNGSYMRKTLLGNSGTPSSPPANSMLAALPSDLRAVMKSVTKYSDNTGADGSDLCPPGCCYG